MATQLMWTGIHVRPLFVPQRMFSFGNITIMLPMYWVLCFINKSFVDFSGNVREYLSMGAAG